MKYILIVFILFFEIFQSQTFPQNFKSKTLITLPGNNFDVDVYTESEFSYGEGPLTQICWINKLDSVYTLYYKQLSPIIEQEYPVTADTLMISSPKISRDRIIWEQKHDSLWQIVTKTILNDSLGQPEILIDSLSNDPQISLSEYWLAWVENGMLKSAVFGSNNILENPEVIDSQFCSKPELMKFDARKFTSIVYEKGLVNEKQIFIANYFEYPNPNWEISQISNGGNNLNPHFGFENNITYQNKTDDYWQIVYTEYEFFNADTINNFYANCTNPALFTYPVPITKVQNENETPFFVAFDSDSLGNNREIYIKTFYFGIMDSIINISKNQANDYKPEIAFISQNDTVYISILWISEQNNKKDIWLAKDVFNPIISDIKNEERIKNNFILEQNYPNPFNPTTTIEYSIPPAETQNTASVLLKVYDVLGREVAKLVNKKQKPGNYKVIFDAGHLSSGVYYYQLIAGSFVQTRKMILIK